jgi:hypothetical protein
MKMTRACQQCFIAGVGLALLVGCATAPAKKADRSALAQNLRDLAPTVEPAEADLAADTAFDYPRQLAGEYHVVPPAIFNNVLINLGIHSRGRCFEWADDLTVKLMTLNLRTLELHRGVARLGTKHEHSCVVLTAPGQSFTNGIALDAWRHCGRLAWSPVSQDKYPWAEVVLIPAYQTELERAAGKLAAQAQPSGTPEKELTGVEMHFK